MGCYRQFSTNVLSLLGCLFVSHVTHSHGEKASKLLRAPSKPPAPLLSSSGETHLTFFVKPDHTDGNVDIDRYEIQREVRPEDFPPGFSEEELNRFNQGVWANAGLLVEGVTTATLTDLSPNTSFRVRVRAVNRAGSSPWSEPSRPLRTLLPTIPTLPPTNITATDVTFNSVRLEWLAPKDDAVVVTYDVQYRRAEDESAGSDWIDHQVGMSAISTPAVNEIQLVTTLVEEEATVDGGEFWLRLELPFTGSANEDESTTISAPISFNATASQFRSSLQTIRGIGKVHVHRHTPGTNWTSENSVRGAYSWRVEFELPNSRYISPPLLVCHKDTITTNGTYLGGKKNVEVTRLKKGSDSTEKPRLAATIQNLEEHTPYNFRVRAASIQGKGPWSEPVEMIRTLSMVYDENYRWPTNVAGAPSLVKEISEIDEEAAPTVLENQWHRVLPRVDYSRADPLAGGASLCGESLNPSGRRGHSLSVIGGKVYLFGGVMKTCSCNSVSTHEKKHVNQTADQTEDRGERCQDLTAYSNELWEFDPTILVWTLLHPSTDSPMFPSEREHHSATVLPRTGSMIVFGGSKSRIHHRSVEQDVEFLGDVWELRNPAPVSSVVVEGSSHHPLPESLLAANVLYHSTNATTSMVDSDAFEGSACIENIEVEVSLQHECLKEIDHVALYGPSWGVGPNEAPHSRGYQVKLFMASDLLDRTNCTSSSLTNITFVDSAPETILDQSSFPTGTGRYRPSESISQFNGLALYGEWTLAVSSSPTTGQNAKGQLIDWKIRANVKPCKTAVNWTERNSIPGSPRHLHTAVAVGKSIYVISGFDDIWRYDYDSDIWAKVNESFSRPPIQRPVVMTPFGFLAAEGGSVETNKYSRYDILREGWLPLVEPGGASGNENLKKRMASGNTPSERYHSSLCYIGRNTILETQVVGFSNAPKARGVPFLLLFGGDSGLGLDSLLDDMWVLALGAEYERHNDLLDNLLRDEHCAWRLQNSTAHDLWKSSCESLPTNPQEECQWESIMTMAWCQQDHQI